MDYSGASAAVAVGDDPIQHSVKSALASGTGHAAEDPAVGGGGGGGIGGGGAGGAGDATLPRLGSHWSGEGCHPEEHVRVRSNDMISE